MKKLLLVLLAAILITACGGPETVEGPELTPEQSRAFEFVLTGDYPAPEGYVLYSTLTRGQACTTPNGTRVEAQVAGLIVSSMHIALDLAKEWRVDGIIFVNVGDRYNVYVSDGKTCVAEETAMHEAQK